MNPNRQLKRQIRDQNQTVCVSNATNSRSPDDLKSRIFIGNLNTSVITKRHLHLIFIEYGDIKAISMHKGFAFVQYNDQMDAMNAVFAQDGQLIAGQAIDVNLVTKPKPHQKSSKTPSSNESETSGETATDTNSIDNSESDINYISFENSNKDLIENCDSVNETLPSMNDQNMSSIPESNRKITDVSEDNTLNIEISVGQSKRVKLDSDQQNDSIPDKERKLLFVNSCENSAEFTDLQNEESDDLKDKSLNKKIMKSSDNSNQNCDPISGNIDVRNEETIPLALSQIQAYDILICGNCRTFFTSLPLFIQHKRSSKCRLRFVCHCHQK